MGPVGSYTLLDYESSDDWNWMDAKKLIFGNISSHSLLPSREQNKQLKQKVIAFDSGVKDFLGSNEPICRLALENIIKPLSLSR